ncbi:MAG: sensor histidine kinase [Anaeroplasma sp.]
MALYIQAILISKLSFIAVSKILTHLIKRGNEKIKWWLICALCVIPISTFVVIYTLSSFAFNNYDNKTQILAIVSSVVLIISNLFAFYLFDYINKQSYKESKLEFETILFDNERQYYKDLLDNEHTSNKTIHDLKNELFAIRALLENNPNSAYEEINKICEIVDKNKIIKISTSDAVNSLTTAKVNIAKSKGINVDIESFVGNLKNINPIDFCMVLGNLFDNAIEACEPVEINKNIYLELKSMDECISITMKNSTINKNVEIGKTTKVNKNKHGFGLYNIKEVLKEYNGIMRHEIIDNFFIINIIMQSGESL